MPITSARSLSIRNSMGLQRHTQVKDLAADEFRSVFLHLSSEVPETRFIQIQPQSIASIEEMGPSKIVQQIEVGSTTTTESAERITLPGLGATRWMVVQNLWLA